MIDIIVTQIAFIQLLSESCPVITVQKVGDEGRYFYSTKNEFRKLFDYESWGEAVMDIVQEGDCGFEWVEGTDKEQQWTGCYSGEIKAWKSEDSHGRRNCKKCKERGGSGYDSSAAGQWSAGDTIKSKACSLGNSKLESEIYESQKH